MNRYTRFLAGSCRRGWLAALAVAWTSACGPGSAASGPVKLRLATLAPKDTSFHQSLKVMVEKWRKAPGGGAELTIYTDGTMGGEADMVRRMRVGQLQAAMLTAGGLAEIDPAVAGLQTMPLIYRSLDEEVFVREKMSVSLEKRFQAKGFHLLCWADAGWVRFFSREAAVSPEEFKKLKIFVWAGDKDHIQIMREEGYRPVPHEYTDTLMGLQTGLIDTVPTTPTYALTGQFYATASHMLELNWAPLVGGILVTRKAWEALPPETQSALTEAALEAGTAIQARGRQESDEAVEAMVKRGLVVHKVGPAAAAEWERLGERLWPRVRGRMVPAEVFDEVQALLRTYRAGK